MAMNDSKLWWCLAFAFLVFGPIVLAVPALIGLLAMPVLAVIAVVWLVRLAANRIPPKQTRGECAAASLPLPPPPSQEDLLLAAKETYEHNVETLEGLPLAENQKKAWLDKEKQTYTAVVQDIIHRT